MYFVPPGQQVNGQYRGVTSRSRNYSLFVYTILSVSKPRNIQKHIFGITTKQDIPRPWVEDNILYFFFFFFLLFPHFTTDCEKIVLLTSEFNCSRHLIGQFLFCRDYFLSNCDRSFYKILKDIVGLNTIYM